MIQFQFAKGREVPPFVRAELAEKLESLIKGRQGERVDLATSEQHCTEVKPPSHQAAELAGMSPRTSSDAKFIIKQAPEKTKMALRSGDTTISAERKKIEKSIKKESATPTPPVHSPPKVEGFPDELITSIGKLVERSNPFKTPENGDYPNTLDFWTTIDDKEIIRRLGQKLYKTNTERGNSKIIVTGIPSPNKCFGPLLDNCIACFLGIKGFNDKTVFCHGKKGGAFIQHFKQFGSIVYGKGFLDNLE